MRLIIGTGAVNNTGGALAEGTAELHATHIVAVGCKTVAQYGHRLGACGASGSRLASLSLLEYSSDDDDEKDDEKEVELDVEEDAERYRRYAFSKASRSRDRR